MQQERIKNNGLTGAWNYVQVVVGSKLRVEIQIKSGHLHWAKKTQNMKEIDIQKPFHEYWASGEHELTAFGRSSSHTSPLISDGQEQRWLSLENIAALLNYIFLRALRFVSLQPPVASS